MSMSGGWFFVVASEAISVGDLQLALPAGSYVASAIRQRDLSRGLGDRRDGRGDPVLRSIAVSAAGRLGRQISPSEQTAAADRAAQLGAGFASPVEFDSMRLSDLSPRPWEHVSKARFTLAPPRARFASVCSRELSRHAPPRRVVDAFWHRRILAGSDLSWGPQATHDVPAPRCRGRTSSMSPPREPVTLAAGRRAGRDRDRRLGADRGRGGSAARADRAHSADCAISGGLSGEPVVSRGSCF